MQDEWPEKYSPLRMTQLTDPCQLMIVSLQQRAKQMNCLLALLLEAPSLRRHLQWCGHCKEMYLERYQRAVVVIGDLQHLQFLQNNSAFLNISFLASFSRLFLAVSLEAYSHNIE